MSEENQDIIECRNCLKIVGVADGGCSNCGEEICLVCGCTDSEPCPEGCWWVVPNVCSTCFVPVPKEEYEGKFIVEQGS